MPLNLENLPAREAEALAYAEGFTGTARLFARLDDLQRALGETLAELESLKNERDQLRQDLEILKFERAFL